jgi:hypothetical protein
MMALSTRIPAGHYRFRDVARMEWIKLRSLRSTWWTLVISAAGAVSVAAAVGINTKHASGDLTNNALAGIIPALLLTGVLGVLTMTSEYSSGLIRATLAAAPSRLLLLGAKAAVFGAVAVVVGEAAAFISFIVGSGLLPPGITAPALGQPDVLRAVLLSGLSFALIGVFGLGLGAIIRHTGVAVAVLVGGVYIAPSIVGALAPWVVIYTPILIIGNSLSVTRPPSCGGPAAHCPHFLTAWAGLGALALYAAVALGIGWWLLARRDA